MSLTSTFSSWDHRHCGRRYRTWFSIHVPITRTTENPKLVDSTQRRVVTVGHTMSDWEQMYVCTYFSDSTQNKIVAEISQIWQPETNACIIIKSGNIYIIVREVHNIIMVYQHDEEHRQGYQWSWSMLFTPLSGGLRCSCIVHRRAIFIFWFWNVMMLINVLHS